MPPLGGASDCAWLSRPEASSARSVAARDRATRSLPVRPRRCISRQAGQPRASPSRGKFPNQSFPPVGLCPWPGLP